MWPGQKSDLTSSVQKNTLSLRWNELAFAALSEVTTLQSPYPTGAMNHSDHTAPARLLPLMAVAADLRARGHTWAQVALRLGRTERTVRGWKKRYRDTWQHLYREAEEDVLDQITGMATTVMSNLIADQKNSNRWRSCHFMLGKRFDAIEAEKRQQSETPQLSRYWVEMIARAKGKSPQELEQEIIDCADKIRQANERKRADLLALPGPDRPE
jgi:Homeodomain-like domain